MSRAGNAAGLCNGYASGCRAQAAKLQGRPLQPAAGLRDQREEPMNLSRLGHGLLNRLGDRTPSLGLPFPSFPFLWEPVLAHAPFPVRFGVFPGTCPSS